MTNTELARAHGAQGVAEVGDAGDNYNTGDEDLDALLEATAQLEKGPDHNNHDTAMYWLECMEKVVVRLAATRRAIVRAAAAIGQSKEGPIA